MWHSGTWFCGGRGSNGLMVKLDFRGLFLPKQFYDSKLLLADLENIVK